jgi:predicted NBD/HSP70 family sugar kinase
LGSDAKFLPIQKLKFDQLASLNNQMTEQDKSTRTLAVDIGGSGIKVMVLDAEGQPQTERSRLETPQPPKPEPILEAIASLASGQGEFDRVSVVFPVLCVTASSKQQLI